VRYVKLALWVTLGVFLGAVAGYADEKKPEKKAEGKMEMPKPGPEVKKLGYFVGTWKSEGDMKQNSFGMPAGKFTSADKCEWFTGGFSVVCHSKGRGPMGAVHSLGIIAYNPEEKVYTYYGVDNMGFASLSKGKVEGNNWVFTSDEKMGGKSFHGRYTMNVSSPDAYSFKYNTSEDGQTWNLMMEGKASKAGGEKAEEKK
jgi:uncharacterized protein DUF1579